LDAKLKTKTYDDAKKSIYFGAKLKKKTKALNDDVFLLVQPREVSGPRVVVDERQVEGGLRGLLKNL
jgi:hypothetical protein